MRAPSSTVRFGKRSSDSDTKGRFSASWPTCRPTKSVFGWRAKTRSRAAMISAVAREVLPVEGPVGVVPELVPPLVRAVDGEEEGLGVRDVDVDGQAVRGARLPHRVEPPVVHLDERPLAAALAEVEAEGLQDLEALRPRPGRLLDRVGLELRVARVRALAPHRLRAGVEAARVRPVEGGDRLLEALAEAARSG